MCNVLKWSTDWRQESVSREGEDGGNRVYVDKWMTSREVARSMWICKEWTQNWCWLCLQCFMWTLKVQNWHFSISQRDTKDVIPTIFLLFRAFYYFSTTSESLSFVLGLTADQYRGFLYRGIQVVESVLLCLSYCEDNEFSLWIAHLVLDAVKRCVLHIGEGVADFVGSCKSSVSHKLCLFVPVIHFHHLCFSPRLPTGKGKPGRFRTNSLQDKDSSF